MTNSPKGKLYTKYYNTIRSMKQSGLISTTTRKEKVLKPLYRTTDKENTILGSIL